MAKLSSMYGTDDDKFASSISSQALGAPDSDRHSGSPLGEKGSKGNTTDPGEVVITKLGMGSDKRAVSKGDCPK